MIEFALLSGVEDYPSHDVLEDVEFKEAMKEYS